MRVNKNLLLQKSNEELEKYLLPNGGYVPDAIEYAFEILKERGRDFSEEETAKINELIYSKKPEPLSVHVNHIKASNLMYASAALGLINIVLIPEMLSTGMDIFTAFFCLAFIAALGLFIRKGFTKIKYLLLGLFIIGIMLSPTFLAFLFFHLPISAIINLTQTVLQLIAIILLFAIPKQIPLAQPVQSPIK